MREELQSRLNVTRQRLIQLLNEDLAGEYQAIIAYVVYSRILKGAAYTDIARELELHVATELQYASTVARQIDRLGGSPCVVVPKALTTSNHPVELLTADLENSPHQSRPAFHARGMSAE